MKKINTFEPISKRTEASNLLDLPKSDMNCRSKRRRLYVSLITNSKSINRKTSKRT